MKTKHIVQALAAAALLGSVPIAGATTLRLVPEVVGDGFSFTWLHAATNASTFGGRTSDVYYPSGSKRRVTTASSFTGSWDPTDLHLTDILGSFTLEDGGSLVFTAGDLDFETFANYGNGAALGYVDYTYTPGSSPLGAAHSGRFYFNNEAFDNNPNPGDIIPNAVTQIGVNQWEARLWGNNWDVTTMTRAEAITFYTGDPMSDDYIANWRPLGMDFAFQVPDGGTTVLLLGVAVSGLGLIRRFTAK